MLKWRSGIGVLGGILWMICWTRISLYPPAAIGEYREGEELHGLLITSIGLLVIGQLLWMRSQRAYLGVAARVCLGLVSIAILLLAIGRFNQTLGGDPQPLVAIGWILTALSMLAFSFLLGRNYVWWIRALILVSAISFGLLSEQDWRSWLALPYGICWIIIFLEHTRRH